MNSRFVPSATLKCCPLPVRSMVPCRGAWTTVKTMDSAWQKVLEKEFSDGAAEENRISSRPLSFTSLVPSDTEKENWSACFSSSLVWTYWMLRETRSAWVKVLVLVPGEREEEEKEEEDFPPPNSAHCHASLQKSQLERISPDHLQLA
ncbi:hypothetical protein EYF80_043374 [Liparis tanakae]|uniref:Uncharacterized protein n=1 Tax=Liparis tanakae TaxID=230148 RepID=A0A4Z2FZ21_9TELE|nr:hypothetical protein EYF80_043374 [Liparis tanakae]